MAFDLLRKIEKNEKTPYQQNVSQPVNDKWYKGSQPTTREAVGQLILATQQDKARGIQLQNDFQIRQQDPTSIFYAPYTQITNKYVTQLGDMGYDISNIDDDWFNATSGLDEYLQYNGTTNTPSSPGKKASANENAAYARFQVGKWQDQTTKAKTECAALQEEINFLATWQDRNYSDDDIMEYIYGNDGEKFKKKYPTLAAMDESMEPGKAILQFNEPIPYSKDWVYGNIWAARNDGGTGNYWQDMGRSALGEGNQWVENKDISARLDDSNPDTYAPYTVGSTTDDVLMYFNVPSYDKEWLNNNRPDKNDQTAVDMWNKGWDAADFTEKAKEELEMFNKRLDRKLQNATDPEKVMNGLDSMLEDYPYLQKLDKSTNKIDSLIGTSEAIAFSRYDIRNKVNEACAKNAGLLDGDQTLSNNGINTGTDQSTAVTRANDQKVVNDSSMIDDMQTDAEHNATANTPSTMYSAFIKGFTEFAKDPAGIIQKNEPAVTNAYTNSILPLSNDIYANRQAQDNLDKMNAANLEIVDRCDEIRNGYTSGSGVFGFMYDIEDGPTVKRGDADVANSRYAPALAELYEAVTGESAIDEDGGIKQNVMSDALLYYDYIMNGNASYEEDEEVPWLMPEYTNLKKGYEAEIERTAGAQAAYENEQAMWDARIQLYDSFGIDSTGLRTARDVAAYMEYFAEYEPTQWDSYSLYDSAMRAMGDDATYDAVIEATKEDTETYQYQLGNMMELKNYLEENNIEVPENYMTNLNRYIGKLERTLADYEYFQIRGADDFEERAARGEKIGRNFIEGTYIGTEKNPLNDVMTEDEKKTFYYLCDLDPMKAQEYYNHLADDSYGVLHTRLDEEIQKRAKEEVDAGFWSGAWANLKAIGSAPFSAIASGAYTLETILSGEEYNPHNMALGLGRYANAVNEATMQSIHDTLGEGTFLDQLASGAYEIVYNRGRSMANQFMFSFLGNLTDTALINEFLGSIPMATEAMGMAIADAKEKNIDDTNAYLYGGITFFAESLSEAITYGNIQEALQGTDDEVIRSTKDLLINWLKKSGIEEMAGETVTEIVEKLADEQILGAYSDHESLIASYIEKLGLDPDNPVDRAKAEEYARRDELGSILHTALISYLSPGLDVVSGTVTDFARDLQNVRLLTREQQKNGNAEANMANTWKEYKAWKQKAQEAPMQATAETPAEQEQTETAPDQEAKATEEGPKFLKASAVEQKTATKPVSEADQIFLTDLSRLDAVQNSDSSTQAAAIGSLFGGVEETKTGDMAKAAAASMTNVFGSMAEAVNNIKNILTAANSASVDYTNVKSALQTAALSASSSAAELVQSEGFIQATPVEQAETLAGTVEADQQNETVAQEIDKSVYENRVAEVEKELIANGALDAIRDAQARAEQAKENVRMAQESLDEKHSELQAKADALNVATKVFNQEPSADNQHMLDRAINEYDKADIVAQEYEQHLDSVTRANAEAQDKLNTVKETAVKDVRQQAEQVVVEQDQQRAERDAKIAEQQRIEAEQAVQAQAEEDERSGKAWEDSRDNLIENILDNEHLEGEERDARQQELTNMADQIKLSKIDMSGLMNNTEGYLAVAAFGRKLGIDFVLSDNLPESARGKYENGVIYLNSNLIKNGKMTVGQALVEASLHEIPHSMENTKNYQTYRKVVLDCLFKGSESEYRAAIDQKKADYRNAVGQELTDVQAEQEIVADFARTHLNAKDVVQRFMDAGLGGKMRNTLHNINQALKNFRLKGEERTTAEYLRRAERAFQKAMDEVAKTSVHPEGGQFSVAQIAQATGLQFDEYSRELYDVDENGNRVIVTEVTPDMIQSTPVGLLIDHGLKGEQNQKAKEMMAGLMSMVAKYKDSNLVWEIGASTLSSTFSALKSNSDPQYKTTVDFGTVCAKTQAIIDVMSRVMLDRVSEGKTGGLTREEIMKVYNEVNKAGLSVPCPVCYVFSRWMGVPSLLGQMSQYQNDFVVADKVGTIDIKATQKKVDEYIKNAEAKYGDAKAINSEKAKFISTLTRLETQREELTGSLYAKGLTNEQKDEIRGQIDDVLKKMTDVDKQIGEVSAYNWVTQALCKKDKNGNYVVDDKFRLTPDEILFDLNRTGEFAKYEKNWTYRNTRGAGMGKAIMPYSGETIGDILYGVKKGGRQIKNPWLNMDGKAAERQLKNAQDRAKKQNLVGGQRLQSTSDFRPEWGLDYIMSFLELQAAGSKVQMYTKVPEAVDFFASVGADVNLSIMGKGQGWHVDENGNKVLDFSNITGMDYDAAKALKNKYNNVQMILVGMNDEHIRLAMANSDIDFIIPWHSSGNSKEVLSGLIKAVGEKLDSSVDYSETQTDKVSENRTPEQKALWDARMKLLTKGGDKLTLDERNALLANPYTADLYRRFTEKGVDPDCYNVKLAKAQAEQIFPYEYWDTSLTKDKADENGKRFTEYCDAMGIVPRFSQFKDDPGYWKLLIDRPMYNNDGTYHQQQAVDVTNARIGNLDEEGKLVDSDLPTQAQAKYAPKDPRNANYEKYTQAEKDAIENAKAALDEPYDEGTEGQYSVYGDVTVADMEQMLAQANEDYSNAVERGDMEAAQEVVDFAAQQAGYTLETFHGTGETFTVFNRGEEGIHLGNREQAEQVADMRYSTRSERTDYVWNDIRDSVSDMTPEQRESLVRYAETILDGDISDKNGLSNFDGDINDSDAVVSWVDSIVNRYEDETWETDTKVRIPTFDRKVGRNLMHLYTKINNPFVINGDIRVWSPINIADLVMARSEGQTEQNIYSNKVDITGSDIALTDEQKNTLQQIKDGDIRGDAAWDALSDVLDKSGFDGIKYLNTFEGDKNSYSYIALKQSDVKSADPVTYDDNGNVIPLSERFNTGNNDIRYSAEGELTPADMEQRLVSSGIVTQDEVDSFHGNLPGMPVTEGGNAYRQFGRKTAQESDALHDDVKEYLYKHSSYTPDTNQAQIDRAISWVQSNSSQSDPDGFFSSLQKAQNGDFDSISADGQARMLTLMGMAALKGEETGDHSAELTLADLFNKQGTEAGRALQARKMFRLMTPVGRMATLNKMADQINEEYGKKGNEHRVRLSDWTLQAAAVAESEEDFQKVQKAAAEELASQMPANWKEKFTAIRMLSMLGNPRTHIRNFVGNLAFMPAVGLKNKIGAGLEAAFVKNGDRTKTIGLATPESRSFAKQYAKQIEGLLRGESKYNEGNAVQQERKIFGQGNGILSKSLGRLTQFLVDANGNALEAEDWVFLNRHFRNALAGYMTANGLTEADMKGDTLDKATAYAVNEAHKATYRDANEVANWMNKVKNPAAKFVINAVLPFKKTPMNILKRGVEYSPVSIIRSLTSDAKHLKQWQAYQNGELSVLPEKAISPSQYIDRLSAGLSGTAFVALGALLSSLGFLRSGMDDDDDELDKLNGSQEYSLEIGGVSFTIDWAAPICMPLFVGATIMDEVKKAASGRGEDVSIGSVLDAVLGIAEPVTQLSMLDGLNSVLNPSNYGDTDSLIQVGEKVITNYATSYVPTLLGQVARTIDTTRRRNFVESGADLKVFRSALEQVENKIPFLSQKNIPYRNVWGEADVSPQGWAAIENFLSPGYGNTLKNDPVTNELKRIYQETGNPSMIPKAAGKTVTINGKNTPLTAEQYDQYVVDRGQTAYNCIKDLMESPVWQICDDDTRALMITDAWNYANQIGRHNVDNRIKKDSWVANAEHNGNFVDVAIERAADSNRTDYIKGYGQTMAEALDSNDSEMFDLSVTALEEAGATDTEIRGALRDYFKPLYQVAFEENDKNTMELIEEKLLDADVGFKEKDIRSWLPSEEEETEIDERWLNMSNGNSTGGGGGGRPTAIPERPASDNDWDQYMDDLDNYWASYDFSRNDPTEQNYNGTIDLNDRQVVHNEDGSISTEYSFSFWDNRIGKEVLIPQVVNGRIVSEQEAKNHYYETGEHLGMFDDWHDADEYSMMLHNRQNWKYNR